MSAHILDELLKLYFQGDYAKAYLALQDVLKTHTQSGDLHVMWAELEIKANGDFLRAEELLGKAQKLGFSEEFRFYYDFVHGDLMLERGRYDEAIKDFERSVAVQSDVNGLRMLGQALSAAGEDRAITVWQEVLDKDPKNCLAYIFLAKEAEKRNNSIEALALVQQAEELNPSDGDEFFEMGRVYHSLSEYSKALEFYFKAEKVGYKDKGDLYSAIASCYLGSGDYTNALRFAERAVEIDPDNGYAREVLQGCRECNRDE
ncbi:MAG: tetratricopeptide repeat protein [Planctomycetota bacterium]|jgi:tetratricopeptide (TPR) repeat protein